MTTTPAEVKNSIVIAQHYATLAVQAAVPFLTPKQAAAATLAQTAITLVARSIADQTDIADLDFATLDARELQILAADAKAQRDVAEG